MSNFTDREYKLLLRHYCGRPNEKSRALVQQISRELNGIEPKAKRKTPCTVGDLMEPKKFPHCGAKTRSGAPCKSRPVTDRRRCRMHGGASPRGRSHPRWKHGKYSKYPESGLVAPYYAKLQQLAVEKKGND